MRRRTVTRSSASVQAVHGLIEQSNYRLLITLFQGRYTTRWSASGAVIHMRRYRRFRKAQVAPDDP